MKKVHAVGPAKETGTHITFNPDAEIFTETEFSWGKILDHLRQQAYLTKGITHQVGGQAQRPSAERLTTFISKAASKPISKSLNRNKSVKNETIFYVDKEIDDSRVEIALQYNDEYNETVLAFANNIYNTEGGTHLIGFRTALTRTLNNYARNQNILKEKEENLTGEDVREGLTAIISVKLTDPQFEGQTKGKLGNAEMKTYVEQAFGEAFAIFLEEHPKEAEAIIGKCILSSQARIAARTRPRFDPAQRRAGRHDPAGKTGRLFQPQSRRMRNLSSSRATRAGGSAKQGRDRRFQAILPLRGKILNVERARLDKMLANNEIKNLVIALGTNIDEQFDIKNYAITGS